MCDDWSFEKGIKAKGILKLCDSREDLQRDEEFRVEFETITCFSLVFIRIAGLGGSLNVRKFSLFDNEDFEVPTYREQALKIFVVKLSQCLHQLEL